MIIRIAHYIYKQWLKENSKWKQVETIQGSGVQGPSATSASQSLSHKSDSEKLSSHVFKVKCSTVGDNSRNYNTKANPFSVYQHVIYKKKMLQLIPRFMLLRDT